MWVVALVGVLLLRVFAWGTRGTKDLAAGSEGLDCAVLMSDNAAHASVYGPLVLLSTHPSEEHQRVRGVASLCCFHTAWLPIGWCVCVCGGGCFMLKSLTGRLSSGRAVGVEC
jgi:hypothetical protein